MYACMHVCMYVCICMHVCMHVCIVNANMLYIYIYIYIYIHISKSNINITYFGEFTRVIFHHLRYMSDLARKSSCFCIFVFFFLLYFIIINPAFIIMYRSDPNNGAKYWWVNFARAEHPLLLIGDHAITFVVL